MLHKVDAIFSILAVDSVLANLLNKPIWWHTLWFHMIVFFFLFFIVLYILTKYYFKQLYLKKAFNEQKEFIRSERQRISGEIHDDIGSGLFAIQLFAEIVSKERDDKEILQISNMVNEISDKINEIIWSTNMGNDNLMNLLYYIMAQATKLFEHSDIAFETIIPNDIPDVTIESQVRKNIYLVVKEFVHNAIKHSKATKVLLTISIDDHFLHFSIKDDGTGFDPTTVRLDAMGLINVKLRIGELKGSLVIENYNGTTIIIKIPMATTSPVNRIKRDRKLFFLKKS